MKQVPFKERVSYKFDSLMAKGTMPLVGLLFSLTLIVVVIVAIIAKVTTPDLTGTIGNSLWQSLMRVLDAGNVAGDFDNGSVIYLILMLIATVCGLFVTSILIGIINAAFESKLADLRKGNSRVLESNHTLILGYDEHLFSILSELIIANENEKKPRIVILSEKDKEELENEIASKIPDCKNTKIICRCGDTSQFTDLYNVSIEDCSQVIVLAEDDFVVMKTVLAATTLLDQSNVPESTYITAVVKEEESLEAIKIAGGSRLELLFFKKTISRIFAQTCRQNGLSQVYQELFDFDGDEIYLENVFSLVGKTFQIATLSYHKACVIGIQRNGEILIDPPMETILLQDDKIIVIAADDGMAVPDDVGKYDQSAFSVQSVSTIEPDQKMLILGFNELSTDIINEVLKYSSDTFEITVASPYEELAIELESCSHNKQKINTENVNIFARSVLNELLKPNYDFIIVLSDMTNVASEDAYTLMLLLQMKNILNNHNHNPIIVSEMQDNSNQKLAQCSNVNDFVIGSNLVSLMMTQVSKNRSLNSVFDILLTDEGSEIYMKPAKWFVKIGVPMDFYTVTQAVNVKNQLFLGYNQASTNKIFVNPAKTEKITFQDGDKIIVIADDYYM